MKKGDLLYQQYLNILEEELRPAMGCTEPIALAYAGAKARQLLGALPEAVEIGVSGRASSSPTPAVFTASLPRSAPVLSAAMPTESWRSSAP